MATQKLVYEIDIKGTDQQVKELNKLEAELKAVTQERNRLIKTQADGDKLNQKQAQTLQRVTQEERKLRGETAALRKEIKSKDAAVNRATGSYDALVAANSKLVAVYRKLDPANVQQAKQMTLISAKIRDNTAKLTQMDATMGRHQRNVGNYSGAIKGAFGNLGLFSREMMIAQQAMSVMSVATKGTTGAMKLLKIALVSTGIGAIVVALGSLVAYFQRTEEGANRFKNIIAPVVIALGNLGDIAGKTGKLIVDLFTFRGDAIRASWEDLTASITGFWEETKRETAEKIELNNKELAQLQRIRNSNIQIAKNELEISKFRLIAADKENFSAEERIKNLEKGIALEQANMAIRLRIAQEDFDIKKRDAALSDSSRETLDALAEAEANLFNIKAQALKAEKKLVTELTTALREQEIERKAIEKATLERNEQNAITRIETSERVAKMAERHEHDITNIVRDENMKRLKWDQLTAEQRVQLMGQVAGAAADLFGQSTLAYRGLASAEALINAYVAINKTLAEPLLPFPTNLIMSGIIGATAFANVAAINGLKFASSGVVPTGYELPTSTPQGDNTLALVKPGEVILNKSHQSALGGAETFRKIGVPGFADSGLVTPNVDTGVLAARSLRQSIDTIRVEVVQSDIRETMKQVDVVESLRNF